MKKRSVARVPCLAEPRGTQIPIRADLACHDAEVLPENLAMLKVFQGCGLPMHTTRDAGVVHVAMLLSQRQQEGTA